MTKLRYTFSNWLLFFVGLGLIVLREPLYFLEPRLWAEEGTRYYVYAYHFAHSPLWYKGLFNVQRGYFALWPNLASTIAANLVPMESVPVVTTLMAFFIQLIPLGLMIWSRSKFWISPLRKLAGILVYLLMPISGEIWLNTINSQFYLALVTILILLEPAGNKHGRKWIYRILIGVAGLTGPVSSMLAPLYGLLAWLTEKRERAIQAIILGICAIIQVGLLMGFSESDKTIGIRLSDVRVYLLVFSIWTQSVGMMLVGKAWMRELASWIILEYEPRSLILVATWFALLLLTVMLFWWLSTRLSARERIILIGSYSFILIISYVGSLTGNKLELIVPGNAQRYFWVPNVIFGFILIANIFSENSDRICRVICATMLLIALMLGGINYRMTLIADWEWPKWRNEVALWQADSEHKIRIWPPGWELILE
jgi:hypothetical protein